MAVAQSPSPRKPDRRDETRVLDADMLGAGSRASDLPAPAHAGVVLVGRSNVGKSSLLNTLLGRRGLARTSRTPGCTRTVNVFRARLGLEGDREATIELVDLPGYGFAQRSREERKGWARTIDAVLRGRAGLRAMVVLVDVRRGLEREEEDCLRLAEDLGLERVLVVTKIDKLSASQRKPAVDAVGRAAGARAIGFSAQTGDGRDPLWRALIRVIGLAGASPERPA
ncbi:MAG: ribosome biogenesis GTP-binding protein YsxC [Deltaproteobacteria bacterium]|nr:ribosome biogenesis GTP-binding protein YsxC [Deltaproteobacteria bacterium]